MANLGDAYVNIVPKAKGIEGNIEKMLSGGSGAEKAGGSIGKKLLSGIAALGIGSAIAGMVKSAFEEGGKLEQSFGGLETIYGESAAAMQQYAMGAAQYGISANDYAEQAVGMGAALRQAFGGDTAAAMDSANMAIQDMADNAAKMGTPVESLQNAYQGFAKQNYTMLDNLKLGYGGTKAEMERLLADASELSGVEYNIDNLGDVYEAIHVVQEELGITGVAADEAKTTFEGSLNSLKSSWTNVMAALTTGEGLDTAMENMTNSVSGFATNVLGMLSNLGPQLPGMILGLADVIIDSAPEFIASGAELIVQLAVGLVQNIPEIVAKVPVIFDGVAAEFKKVDWASLGMDLIKGIVAGVNSMVGTLWNRMREIIRGALGAAKDEAGVKSPSRLFADRLGRYIPAGIAMGIDQNTDSLNKSVRSLIDGSLAAAEMAEIRPMSVTTPGSDADRIIDALRSLTVEANVSLEGDAGKLFKAVQTTNNVRTRATRHNALAAGGIA